MANHGLSMKKKQGNVMIKFVEIYGTGLSYSSIEDVANKRNPKPSFKLREIYINPEYVVYLKEAEDFLQKFVGGDLPEGLDKRQEFTRLGLSRGQSGFDLVVVGAPKVVQSKLYKGESKSVIKG